MKRTLSIVSFSVTCISAAAQLSYQANAPRGGDNVVRQVISLASPGQCSDSALWDFRDKEVGTRRNVVRHVNQKVNGDSLRLYDSGSRYGLEIGKDGVLVTSCENRNIDITYDLPVKLLRFPMEYRDSLSGCFHGVGTYCDRWRTRVFGIWKLKADAMGRVFLPTGDTLRAIRVHLRKRVSNKYYPLDSVHSTLAAFNVDSMLHFQATDTAVMVSDEYKWYARGYRYPVLEYRSAYMESRPEEKTRVAYICPPESQEELPLDDENVRIREGDKKNGDAGNGKHANGNEAGNYDFFRYSFSQDDASKTVHVSYTSDTPVSVKAILANTMGIVYGTETSANGTSGDITISYGDVPRGQYVVYIKTGEKVHTEKFNHK